MIVYPCSAIVHYILLDTKKKAHAEHPESHGTIWLFTVTVLIPPPTDRQVESFCKVKPF
jgi:hypothetical protein